MAIKAKKIKKTAREKVKGRIRKRISGDAERLRLSVFRSNKHIYAQVVNDVDGKTLVAVSTLDKGVLERLASESKSNKVSGEEAAKLGIFNDARSTKSAFCARILGKVLAERCTEKKISSVAFDRNGFLYSGRVKALADGAREGGLQF